MTKWNASDYSQQSLAQKSWAAEMLDKLHLSGEEDVLDLGCGDGKITAAIAARLPRGTAVGADNSSEMIEFARAHHPATDFPNLSFRLADASALPFNEEFDLVFSNAALHWVIDHRPVLAGIHRALRPGGRALLQMGGKGNAAALFEIADQLRQQKPWAQYFDGFVFPWGFYTPEQYRPWLGAAGLTPLRVELFPKDAAQAGVAGLKGWMRTTWMPYRAHLPEELREPFMDEVIRRYLPTHPVDDRGRVHVRMMRLEVEAVKA